MPDEDIAACQAAVVAAEASVISGAANTDMPGGEHVPNCAGWLPGRPAWCTTAAVQCWELVALLLSPCACHQALMQCSGLQRFPRRRPCKNNLQLQQYQSLQGLRHDIWLESLRVPVVVFEGWTTLALVLRCSACVQRCIHTRADNSYVQALRHRLTSRGPRLSSWRRVQPSLQLPPLPQLLPAAVRLRPLSL